MKPVIVSESSDVGGGGGTSGNTGLASSNSEMLHSTILMKRMGIKPKDIEGALIIQPISQSKLQENCRQEIPTLVRCPRISENINYSCNEEVNGHKNDFIVEEDVNELVIETQILHRMRSEMITYPKDWHHHVCGACDEVFFSESGWQQHMDRKAAFRIVHNCPRCDSSLQFYNRCSFLTHLKEHDVTPTVKYLKDRTVTEVVSDSEYLHFKYAVNEGSIDLNTQNLDISSSSSTVTVPSEDEDFIQNNSTISTLPSVNGIEKTINETPLTNVSVASTVPFAISISTSEDEAAEESNFPSVTNSSTGSGKCGGEDGSQKSDFYCTGCQTDYFHKKRFFSHLIEAEEKGCKANTVYRCPTDEVPSWSWCHFLFHKKIFHDKYRPYLCPDCGKTFYEYRPLYDHVREECFHLYKTVRYSCVVSSNCSFKLKGVKGVNTASDLIHHMQNEHSRSVLQCAYCTHAFATREWLFKHLADQHQIIVATDAGSAEPFGGVSDSNGNSVTQDVVVNQHTKNLIQCLICSIVFYTGPSYYQHLLAKFIGHSQASFIYYCPTCSIVCETKSELHHHMKMSKACNKKSESSSTSPPQIQVVQAKNCSLSRHYRPRPQPLRIQPSRSASSTASVVLSRKLFNESVEKIKQCKFCNCAISINSSSLKEQECKCSENLKVTPAFCLACNENYRGRMILFRHGEKHLKEGLQICLFCNNKVIHSSKSSTDSNQSSKGSDRPNGKILEKHLISKHISKVKLPHKCILCKEILSNRKSVDIHFKNHHHVLLQKGSSSSNEHDSTLSEEANNEVVGASPSRRRQSKSRLKSNTKMPRLTKEYSSPELSDEEEKNHKSSKQNGTAKKPRLTLEVKHEVLSEDEEETCLENSEDIRVENQLVTDQLIDKTLPEPVVIEEVPIVKSVNARSEDGTITCLKCSEFSTTLEDVFYEHIRSVHVWNETEVEKHYNGGVGIFPQEETDFWCAECNATFVVKPSLVKHIQFAHDYITDIGVYMEKIGYDAKRPVKENQCEVCYLQCGDTNEHYNHLRTHGMAFLRLRFQRKPST